MVCTHIIYQWLNMVKKAAYLPKHTHVIRKCMWCIGHLVLFCTMMDCYCFIFLLVQYVWSQHYFYPCARHCAIPMYVWNTRHAQHASQCTTTCFTHTRKSNKKSNEMRQTKIYLNAVGILFFLHVCLYIKLCMYVKQSVFHIWRNSINICLILCYIFNKWEIQTQDMQQRNTTLTKLYRTTQSISPLWQGSVVWGHWKQYDVTEHYSMYIYLYIYILQLPTTLSIYI